MAKKTKSEQRRKLTVNDLQHYKHFDNAAISDQLRPVMIFVDCKISNLQCKPQCELQVTAKKTFPNSKKRKAHNL